MKATGCRDFALGMIEVRHLSPSTLRHSLIEASDHLESLGTCLPNEKNRVQELPICQLIATWADRHRISHEIKRDRAWTSPTENPPNSVDMDDAGGFPHQGDPSLDFEVYTPIQPKPR